MNRAGLQDALSHPNVAAFLAVIDLGEHGPNADSPDRYRTMFGGQLFDAPPWVHPRRAIKAGDYTSTAAGRGQFLSGTWGDLVAQYAFPDFSPPCQDEAIVALIYRRGALADVIAGRIKVAIEKCAKEWASLPGSPYGQPTLTIEKALARYRERGGTFAEDTVDPIFNPDSLETEHYGDPPMALPLIPLITAFGPELVKLIPQFASMFGSGSEVQIRNAKAAEAAVSAVVEATQSPNLQAAIEKMQADPEAAKAGQIAAAEVLSLIEVGGGIAAARKASEAYASAEWWRMLVVPQTWIALLLLGLVYMALGNVTGLWGYQQWTPELRSNVVFAIVGVAIGSVSGYYFGTSQGSQRKTDILANQEK